MRRHPKGSKYASVLAALTLTGIAFLPQPAQSSASSLDKNAKRTSPIQQADASRQFGEKIEESGFGAYEPSATQCLTESDREIIRANIQFNQSELHAAGQLQIRYREDVRYDWPLKAVGSAAANGYGVHGISNFVDLDPAYPSNLLDYRCGTRTYDQSNGYNHRGIDFFTWPFGWKWMDDDAVQVVAVAPGTIVYRADGYFDESCGLSGGAWNAVYVQHHDGSVAWYGHMKDGSLTPKTVGQPVSGGEYLGVVGSSGNSSGPHLHLELYDPSGTLVEPFKGPCNTTTPVSLWNSQRPYYDSAINRLMIGTAPVSYPSCPGRAVSNEATSVSIGATIYFTVFYRDQRAGQLSSLRIVRPNGTIYTSWSHSSTTPHYAASYWWWSTSIGLGNPSGVWKFEVDYEGESYTTTFIVN